MLDNSDENVGAANHLKSFHPQLKSTDQKKEAGTAAGVRSR